MRASREVQGSEVRFVISEVPSALREAVQALAFSARGDSFVQTYPADHPQLDRIFSNFQRCIDELVLQKARRRSVPWEEAFVTFCQRVEGEAIDWWLTGSGALAVRGPEVSPRDLDLAVSRASGARLEHLMLDDLIEPPRPGFISDTFTRSFARACLEWCTGIDARADSFLVGDVGLTAAGRLETVNWHGFEIRVPPLDLQLIVNEARGLSDRVSMIKQAMTNSSI